MLKHVLAALVLSAAVLAPAAAGARETVIAQLQAPLGEARQVVAGGAVWSCEGDRCKAGLNDRATVRTCRQLAREVGPLTAFGPQNRPLGAEDLARCNEGIQTADTNKR